MEAYHVVTDRPMEEGQLIVFDAAHHSGVFRRVTDKADIVRAIYADPASFNADKLEHHTRVALRELAMEEIRLAEHPEYPSRLSCLYVSGTFEEAQKWADFFADVGRPVYSVVRLRITGRVFAGNAENCFYGTPDREENLRLARYYWEHPWENGMRGICEMLMDGTIRVEEIVKRIDRNTRKEDKKVRTGGGEE